MPIYEYQAINSSTGKDLKGKVDAPSEKQASSQLQSQGLYLVSIALSKTTEKKGKKGAGFGSFANLFQPKIPKKMVTDFTRQYSILVDTGIPYDKAFEIIIQETKHPGFQSILSDIRSQIIEGSSLAVALENRQDLFPKMFTSMVRAGEAGGTLSKVLGKLATYREEQAELKGKIKSAMIYPAIMTLLGVGIVIFMVTFILPKIIPIFQSFKVDLPIPTRIVIFMSDMAIDYGYFMLIGILAIAYSVRTFISSKKGEKLFHRFVLNIPVLKTVVNKIIVFRFTQGLGTLMKSGVDLRNSLSIVKFVTGNRVFEDSLDEISVDITGKGLSLSQALKKNPLFTGAVIQMLRIGEESNEMEQMLVRISDNMEKDVKDTLENAITLLEPMIMLGMAVSIGFIIMAVMMPMFQLNQLIGGGG